MYKKIQAENGLNVIVSPMAQMASISLGVWIGLGGRYETLKQSGISHFVEHMLFKGTHTRTAKQLKEAIEGVGGVFNGFTADEATCYMVKVPSKYLELGMDILADMVLDAKFDEADILKEKSVICEEIKMYKDQPADYVLDILGGIMWPSNALGRPLTGTISAVKNFHREELITFKENSYHPNNITVVACGKTDENMIFDYAAKKFEGWEKKKNPCFESPVIEQEKSCMKVSKKDTKQAHIAMGFHTDTKDARERFAIKMMNIILGGNMSSRLFEELREKYGLCYDISSTYKRHSDVGELQIHAGVDRTKAAKSVIAILDELKTLRDIGVIEDELTRAKEYAKGQFLLTMEGTANRMLWFGERFVVYKDIPEVKDVLEQIDKVTREEVQKICGKIFKPQAANLAIVGNVTDMEKKKIKRELDNL